MHTHKLGNIADLNLLNNNELVKIIEKKYIKTKGCFRQTQDISKGYNTLVIARALFNFFVYSVSVEDSVKNNTNIYDFPYV